MVTANLLKRIFLFFIFPAITISAADLLPPGNRPLPLGVHALVGGKVVVNPGQMLDSATILIRDGLIEAVGTDLEIPADARVWEMKGMTVYAGFIDPYLSFGAKSGASSSSKPGSNLTIGKFYGIVGAGNDPGSTGPSSDVAQVTPERRAAVSYSPDEKTIEKLRELGFTSGNLVFEKGVFRGTTAFVALSETDPNRALIKPDVFQQVVFDTENGRENSYPESLMGVIAVVRQTLLDAQHYALDVSNFQKQSNRLRPEFNPALEALRAASEGKMRVLFEPESALMVDRVTRIAEEMKLDFCIVSSGQEWRRPELAKAANVPFIVRLDFPELSKLPDDDDWNDISLDQLRAWDWAPDNASVLRQQKIEIALTTDGLTDKKNFRRNLKGALERGLAEADALAALTTVPAKICGVEKLLGTIEAGKLANLTVVDGNYFQPETRVREVWVDGRIYRGQFEKRDIAKEKKADEEKKQPSPRIARPPLEGRGPITNAPDLLIRNATIWTSGAKGILTNSTLVIANGKISNLGAKVEVGPNTFVIEGEGLHITPGLIDCHSHAAILGNVNESSLPSTAMVRIGDVINSETDNLHEELAGGLTIANLLHGSANPIGGQNCVIKLRDGAAAEDLKFADAPAGIKFALGENVKQANWGDKYKTRFPQTRMGVKTFIENRFIAAQQYAKDWEKFKKSGGLAPRRDLELEAIDEIIRGQRLIHCHSYRQDEILMMIRLMESFGVKIGTFQHVLEGYKVADEIAAHGAGASTFSDWWGYKFEVYDAIPFNGSLLRERGVLVSFNSDSPDLARRLNTEAAKAVKYGGMPEQEALNLVT
ncbi:MAG: amidohydrolase family protein, partial [Verrucomicrobiota bacterium]